MTSTPTDKDVELGDFGLFDPAVQQCPHAYYARMREEAPIFFTDAAGIELHLVTRHHDVLEVLRDTDTYSSQFDGGGLPASGDLRRRLTELIAEQDGYPSVSTLLTADPPAHTRYRKLVNKAFTPRAIAGLEPTIRAITTELIDGFIDEPTVEFVERFAVPLPVTTIAKALNVPDDRLSDFKRWSDDAIAGIGTNIDDDQRVEAQRGVIEFQKYFAAQLDERRTDPRDDILTRLLEARIDSDEDPDLPSEPLSMPEMLSIIQQLLVAGNETTTKMLTEMMRLFGENPGEWAAVRDDPSRVKAAVEETLRLSTPTQGMWRIVRRDTELAGVSLPAGSRVVAMFTSANRDESLFADPDTFDPDRDGLTNQIAFGKGVHYCLGANLSRLEGTIALEELSRRIAAFRLADSNDYAYHPSFMLRGLKRLELELR
ncbi:MAG: cytochrome P450 [Acidimicrobiia bacterium]|nr:cytochrome P450 [Acidimicrobiia bacterium]